MIEFFKPYEGKKPYIFISYSHRNSAEVIGTIRLIHDKMYQLWYDEGIPAGSDWPRNIAVHMDDCQAVLFFMSRTALESPNCLSEMTTAARQGKKILLMKLEDVSFTDASVSISDELLLAECIRCDLIVRKDGILEWNIPVFTPEEAKKMASVVHEAAAELAGKLLPTVKGLYQRMLKDVPAHLHDQIRGIFGIECNSIIEMLCELLLNKPEAAPFAGQVIMFVNASDAPHL